MTTTLKLSVAAASALVVGGILWLGFGDGVVPPREVATARDRDAPLPDPPPEDAVESPTLPAPAVVERAPVDTVESASAEFTPIFPNRGSLRLKTVLESDGSAAPNIHIRIVPLDRTMPFPDLRRAKTNDLGELLLRDLLPGTVKVAAAGFDAGGDAKSCVRTVVVVAGEVVEASLLLPDKYLVRGEVVNGLGKPVPAADIWVSDVGGAFSDGVFATSADSQGRFELMAAGVMHFIAARAPGYAMSQAVYPTFLHFGDARSVRLVLSKPGATFSGRVLDPEGRPVVRALVVVEVEEGTSTLLENAAIQERPPPRIARTDQEGGFELDSLPPGPLLVAARAEGFAVLTFRLEFEAGATIERDLRLDAGATIVGRLTNVDGTPANGVTIEAWAHPGGRLGLLVNTKTTADEDGEFEIARLPPGRVTLNVEAGAKGSVRKPVELPESGSIRCDLVLACGKSIRGRVVDEHDGPLVSARVDAVPVTSAPRIPPPAITDADGRFEIQDCGDVDWKLIVYQELNTYLVLDTLEPVRPGGNVLTLVIGAAKRATASIRGRFLDPDGRPVIALVSIAQEGGNAVFSHASQPNGEFESPLVPPGRYSLWASLEGYAGLELGWQSLEQDQTLDLGELRFSRPASLVVHAMRDDGGPVRAGDVTLRGAGEGGSVELVLAGSELRADRVTPGDYLLEVLGQDVARRQIPVTCKAGEAVTLDLLIESGVTREFTIRRSDGLPLNRVGADRSPATLRWTASDANGHELHGSLAAAPEAMAVELELCLAVGDWSLEVTGPDGARGEAAFAASRRQRDDEPILITLDAR